MEVKFPTRFPYEKVIFNLTDVPCYVTAAVSNYALI